MCCRRTHASGSNDVPQMGLQQGSRESIQGSGFAPGGASVGAQGGLGMGPNPRPGVSLSCNTDGYCSVLPTATVNVMSAKGPVKATLIFDSGSDRTYVSEQLMKKVQGRWKGSCEMTCAAFGGGKSESTCNVYELDVSGANVAVPTVQTIQAVQVPVICAPLVRPSVDTSLLRSFNHVELADESFTSERPLQGPQQIDLLVGQDRYWTLMGLASSAVRRD